MVTIPTENEQMKCECGCSDWLVYAQGLCCSICSYELRWIEVLRLLLRTS